MLQRASFRCLLLGIVCGASQVAAQAQPAAPDSSVIRAENEGKEPDRWTPDVRVLPDLGPPVAAGEYTIRIPKGYIFKERNGGMQWQDPGRGRDGIIPWLWMGLQPRRDKVASVPPVVHDNGSSVPDAILFPRGADEVRLGTINNMPFVRATSKTIFIQTIYGAYDGDKVLTLIATCSPLDTRAKGLLEAAAYSLQRGGPSSRRAEDANAIPADWHVRADPPAKPHDWKVKDNFSYNIQDAQEVFTPARPSPLFITLKPDLKPGFSQYEVVNVVTGTRFALMHGDRQSWPGLGVAFSEDGLYLAVRQPGTPSTIVVWSTKEERKVAVLPTAGGYPYCFGNDDSLLAGHCSSDGAQCAVSLWDIKTGKEAWKGENTAGSDEPSRKHELAISPGGKFLARISNKKLSFFGMEDGKLVSQVEVPDAAGAQCGGLAFSTDGSRIAALIESDHFKGASVGRHEQVMVWELTAGRLIGQYLLEFPIKSGMYFADAALQWFPDDKAWLIDDYYVADSTSGKFVHVIAKPPARGNVLNAIYTPRRVVDNTHIVARVPDPSSWKIGRYERSLLRAEALPRGLIDPGIASAASSGEGDSLLPPQTASDSLATPSLQFTPPASWSLAADPAPHSVKTFTAKPIALKSDSVADVLFSDARAGIAAVLNQVRPIKRDPVHDVQRTYLTRYDLVSGSELDTLTFPEGCHATDLLPDGSRVLVTFHRNDGDRVDVWTLGTKASHVAGWRPYPVDPGLSQPLDWSGFIDVNHVLTVSNTGLAILWELPTCKAVWKVDLGVRHWQAFSPTRKYLALVLNNSLLIVDPLSGRALARKGFNTTAAPAVSFDPGGTQLAVCVGGTSLSVYDLASGKLKSQHAAAGWIAQWLAPPFVLLGDKGAVFDLSNDRVVWTYEMLSLHLYHGQMPDGRYWHVTAPERGNLLAIVLPDPQEAAQVASGKPAGSSRIPVATRDRFSSASPVRLDHRPSRVVPIAEPQKEQAELRALTPLIPVVEKIAAASERMNRGYFNGFTDAQLLKGADELAALGQQLPETTRDLPGETNDSVMALKQGVAKIAEDYRQGVQEKHGTKFPDPGPAARVLDRQANVLVPETEFLRARLTELKSKYPAAEKK